VTRLLLFALLLALAGCREEPRKLGAVSFTGPGPEVAPIYCAGTAADDSTAIQAVLNKGKPARIVSPVCTVLTQLVLYGDLYLGGGTLNCATGNSGQTGCIIASTLSAPAAQQGVSMTLASTPTVGAASVTVTTNPGLVAGDTIVLSDATYFALQSIQMAAITGSGNPYTIWLGNGRRVTWAYNTGVATAYSNTPAGPVHLFGEGATIHATALQARGIEFSNCQNCSVSEITLSGPMGWGAAYDVGSYRSEFRDVRFVGDELLVSNVVSNGGPGLCRLTTANTIPAYYITGTTMYVAGVSGATGCNGSFAVTRINNATLDLQGSTFGGAYTSGGLVTYSTQGIAFESCEQCRGSWLWASGVKGRGLYVYNSKDSVFEHVRVSGCASGYGASLDELAGPYGSVGSTLRDFAAEGCNDGIYVADNATRWRLSGLHITNAVAAGIFVDTNTTGTATGTLIENAEITGSGTYGVNLNVGDDAALVNTWIKSAGTAALYTSGTAKRTRVQGGRWDSNAGVAIHGAGDLRVSDLVAYNNTQGVTTTSALNLDAVNVLHVLDASSVNSTYNAWNQTQASTWKLTNCGFIVTGSPAGRIGVITSAGRVDVSNYRAIDGSAANSYSLFINGGGEIRYATNDLQDTTTNGVFGTVTANGATDKLH
jgi:hypothetical protein